MKLIGAALSRTGTMSLMTALEGLGLRCYHMKECLLNTFKGRGDLDRWLKVFTLEPGCEERLELLRQIYSGYDACCDTPSCFVYQELAALFPEAPVLLTRRNAARWRKSFAGTVYRAHKILNGPLAPLCVFVFQMLYRLPFLRVFGVMGIIAKDEKMIMGPFFTDDGMLDFESEADAREIENRFTAWIDRVEESIPQGRLISIEPPYKDAYRIICTALKLPVPEKAYPHVNDSEDLKRAIGLFHVLFYAVPAVSVAALLGTLAAALFSGAALPVLGYAGALLLLLYGLQALLTATIRSLGKRDNT